MNLNILLLMSFLLSFSCKDNEEGKYANNKAKLKSQKNDLIIVAQKDTRCNVEDSLRIRFESFNTKETSKNAYEIYSKKTGLQKNQA